MKQEMICISSPLPEDDPAFRGVISMNGGDSEPDHDGGHGSDGDGNWDGK